MVRNGPVLLTAVEQGILLRTKLHILTSKCNRIILTFLNVTNEIVLFRETDKLFETKKR